MTLCHYEYSLTVVLEDSECNYPARLSRHYHRVWSAFETLQGDLKGAWLPASITCSASVWNALSWKKWHYLLQTCIISWRFFMPVSSLISERSGLYLQLLDRGERVIDGQMDIKRECQDHAWESTGKPLERVRQMEANVFLNILDANEHIDKLQWEVWQIILLRLSDKHSYHNRSTRCSTKEPLCLLCSQPTDSKTEIQLCCKLITKTQVIRFKMCLTSGFWKDAKNATAHPISLLKHLYMSILRIN